MTKQEFEDIFDILTFNSPVGSPLVYFVVQLRVKETGKIINITRFQLSEMEISEMVMDTMHTLVPFTREYIIDTHTRYALDLLARMYSITDWFPLNKNTDISMY